MMSSSSLLFCFAQFTTVTFWFGFIFSGCTGCRADWNPTSFLFAVSFASSLQTECLKKSQRTEFISCLKWIEMIVYAYCSFHLNRTEGLRGDVYYLSLIMDPHSVAALFLFVMSEKRSAQYQRVCKIKQRATESISPESKEELLWDCKMEMRFFPWCQCGEAWSQAWAQTDCARDVLTEKTPPVIKWAGVLLASRCATLWIIQWDNKVFRTLK